MTKEERQAYVMGVLSACLQAHASPDVVEQVCRELEITAEELLECSAHGVDVNGSQH
jgi:hypothetical protein